MTEDHRPSDVALSGTEASTSDRHLAGVGPAYGTPGTARMRHVIFETQEKADAFIADLTTQTGGTSATGRPRAHVEAPGEVEADLHRDTPAEEVAEGAVNGTFAGGIAGGVIGLLGIVIAGALTGGAAVPVILGMVAVGAGVGAATGAVGGVVGVEEHGTLGEYQVHRHQYEELHGALQSGHTPVAVDPSIPENLLTRVMTAHEGRLLT